MGNTNSCIRRLKEVFSSLTGASSVSEYFCAPAASETEDAPTSCLPLFDRAYTECMIERSESGKHRSIKESIERSKRHWSVRPESGSNEEEVAEVSNVEVFKTVQMHPTRGAFFRSFGEGEADEGELVVGEKFAESAQAELHQADVYSYGMTCYEILTGKFPFEGHPVWDYDHVLKGQRPVVPDYVDDRTRELLSRCWETNPDARPSFGEIVDLLK